MHFFFSQSCSAIGLCCIPGLNLCPQRISTFPTYPSVYFIRFYIWLLLVSPHFHVIHLEQSFWFRVQGLGFRVQNKRFLNRNVRLRGFDLDFRVECIR